MRILIADDNRDITDSLALLLSAKGHVVETAYDGFEACDQADHFLPEATLLDIRMPGKHGYDVAGHLKGIGSVLEGGIIGMTGEGGPDARRRAAEAGFDHLVIKPTSIEVIAELLSRVGNKPRGGGGAVPHTLELEEPHSRGSCTVAGHMPQTRQFPAQAIWAPKKGENLPTPRNFPHGIGSDMTAGTCAAPWQICQ